MKGTEQHRGAARGTCVPLLRHRSPVVVCCRHCSAWQNRSQFEKCPCCRSRVTGTRALCHHEGLCLNLLQCKTMSFVTKPLHFPAKPAWQGKGKVIRRLPLCSCLFCFFKDILRSLDNKTPKASLGSHSASHPPLLKPSTATRFDPITWRDAMGAMKPLCTGFTCGSSPRETTLASGQEATCHHPSAHYATSRVSTAGTAAASRKFLGPKASVKQIPWQEGELFAPDGPPGILVNPVLRLCHKEA